ncbi:MAG: hypothetical protein LLG05_10115 [Porphyromonadaceae bacterium]|nr:hypothetical protein [Porphyromonadaceae bacterium]
MEVYNMKLSKILRTMLAVCFIFMLVAPAMAASDDSDEEDTTDKVSDSTIDWQEWFNPADGVDELESSPVGNPLKKFVNLVIGLVILYGAASILKSWFKSNSDDGEKASDGYMGMMGKAIGALVMVGCVAMYFYFLGYKL